jgi:hypothetical protein
MTSCIDQTISGIKRQILRIRELAARLPDQEIFTSLTLFNESVTPAGLCLGDDGAPQREIRRPVREMAARGQGEEPWFMEEVTNAALCHSLVK